jgi:hypothetical protein
VQRGLAVKPDSTGAQDPALRAAIERQKTR